MKVILISGKAMSGKDTVSKIIEKQLRYQGQRVLIAHYADLVKHICKSMFGWNGEKDEKGRTLLQYVGTDVVRSVDENYWVKYMTDMLAFFGDNWDYVLIPDCRFKNEISYLKECNIDFVHVRVNRGDYQNELSEEQRNHQSEIDLDDIKPDFYVENNSNLIDLTKNVIQLSEVLYEQINY